MIAAVIGAGAWGTALGITIARGRNDAILWSHGGDIHHFDNVEIPRNIRVTRDMHDIRNTDVWFAVTPAAYFRETMIRARPFYSGQPIIICTKGAEPDTGAFMSEILQDTIPNAPDIAVLSGPQFALEVANQIPTGSTIAGTETACRAGRTMLSQMYLESCSDIIGTELCGVGKNAVALISGFTTGAGYGENTRAMIFTRAWGEIVDLGIACGAEMRTFLGLAGIGDLFLSATSDTSRNFAAGRDIAHGVSPTGKIEGINALGAILQRATKMSTRTDILTDIANRMGLAK